MVGSALHRNLKKNKKNNIITATRNDLNLLDQRKVNSFFENNKIEQVYIAAAKVGGIHANNIFPADFIYKNLLIQLNIINAAHQTNVNKLLSLGSSCIYPKDSIQPIKEDMLLTGKLEATNEPYAVAKIAGIKLCESYNRQYGRDYRSVMPTNLYGPNDNFHSENSHVIPGLIQRFHIASIQNLNYVKVWGSGKPMREFLHVDDMAAASIYVMNLDKGKYVKNTKPMLSHINIGFGKDYSIKELAEMIAKVTNFKGKIIFDDSKPDGTPRKLMDNTKIKSLGWQPSISLIEGLRDTYDWYVKNIETLRKK